MSRARRTGSRRLMLVATAAIAVALVAYGGWQALGPREEPAREPDRREEAQRLPAPAAAPPEHAPRREPAKPTEDAPAPAEEPPREARDPQAHEILADMREAWECYAAADCTLGADTDPRAEYFAASDRLAGGMRTLIQQHRDHRISDPELGAAALEVLQYDSGPARAAAIEALRALPSSEAHLDALVTTLDQHHDEKLFELALPELQRYAERGHRDEVDDFLQSNLRSGAHFPARTIARGLGPFLTPENVAEYQALAESLPDGARHKALLLDTLRAYRASD